MFRCACVVSLFCMSCAPAEAQRVSAASRVEGSAPVDLLPRDLDATVRIDVTRLAGELGAPLAREVLVDLLVDPADEAGATWLSEALALTELSWLGFRAGGELWATEKVLVSRGTFSSWQRRAPDGFRWFEPADGGAPYFFLEGAQRGAFERIYPLDAGLLVFSTSAAMSPPVTHSSPASAPLRPPERGTISASARAAELVDEYLQDFPRLAEHFTGAEYISGYAEPHATNLELDLEITFGVAEQARAGSEVISALIDRIGERPCALGQAARTARVSSFGRSARLQAELGEPEVRALKACAFTGECCARARAD
jgi:hypothetical protein